MKVFSFSQNDNPFGIGVITDKGAVNLTRAFDIYQHAKGVKQPISLAFLQMMVEMGYFSAQVIQNILSESWVQSKQVELQIKEDFRYEPPISRPSKIVCLGRNYSAHAKELNHKVPDEPLIFCKAPSTLIPHKADIVIPPWLDSRVDHEAELAVVIGKMCKNITEAEAMDYIAGYTLVNDVTARAMQKEDTGQQKPWFRSKSLDTFCPIGPYLIPADSGIDPHSLVIELTVNGKMKQKAKTADMLFRIPEIIASISRLMTLEPGDIIATGTPEGVSPIKDGDEIEITIPEIGTLKNRVVKDN